MNPTPYLFFQGTCREAIALYAEVFGGEIEMMMSAAEMPPGEMEIPPEKADWIMHAAVKFDAGQLMASDDISGTTPPMQGASVHMDLPTTEDGRRAFDRLAEGGEVRMPYQATFWTPGFGVLRDRYGISWMISTSQPLA